MPRHLALIMSVGLILTALNAEERTESFDTDPDWDGLNNRSTSERRPVVQNFGHVPPTNGQPGGVGGTICPDGTPAYYAMIVPETSLDDPLSASGTLMVKKGAGNVLLGFFNAATINEWRTPNTLAFRLNGRGDTFHAHTEYATSKWRAGAGIIGRYDPVADRMHPIENPSDRVYRWSILYDPDANNGAGRMTATLDDHTAVMDIHPDLRNDGAAFNRFGFLNVVKHPDTPGEFFIHNLIVNGEAVDLSVDPNWDARGNHASYLSDDTRPRFNFGYSPTHYAGGKAAGEIGGLFFRGDCRYPDKLAYYGAKTEPLSLAKPLRASGKLTFRKGMSDSTTLFGFFHYEHSVKVHDSQKFGCPSDVLGFSIGGPSAQGFYIGPLYRVHGEGQGEGSYQHAPRIYPDATVHDWTLTYDPQPDGSGLITFSLDDHPPCTLTIPADHIAQGAEFNRFGFVTPWIDGNAQVVYLDDLTFTVRQ